MTKERVLERLQPVSLLALLATSGVAVRLSRAWRNP